MSNIVQREGIAEIKVGGQHCPDWRLIVPGIFLGAFSAGKGAEVSGWWWGYGKTTYGQMADWLDMDAQMLMYNIKDR